MYSHRVFFRRQLLHVSFLGCTDENFLDCARAPTAAASLIGWSLLRERLCLFLRSISSVRQQLCVLRECGQGKDARRKGRLCCVSVCVCRRGSNWRRAVGSSSVARKEEARGTGGGWGRRCSWVLAMGITVWAE